ncbi:MAG: hypothetical protein J5852_01665, partial [Clostridia bacterium]|nr:hypothetical protein [Clostridia bacterium]
MRKAVCILLCVLLCFSLSCCKNAGKNTSSKTESEVKPLKNEEINLLYYSGDSFNPYTAATKYNRELAHLLYDPLIKCDNNFSPVYCLASDAVLDGTVCTVTLKTAYFTDGSPVTADDVLYSYNLAKNSDTVYSSRLYEIGS